MGEARLAPPAEPESWSGTFDATAPGPRCVQAPAPPTFEASSEEDCLSLNITAPSDTSQSSDHPVLVWLHGGGFSGGAGSDYDPKRLVVDGSLVVVTINYRLGALGFLGPEGTDANFGLLDQQAALRWVQNNIGDFGGDPTNVTLAGQSAGADSVCAQLASSSADGLYQRAILQSGSCSETNVTDAILPGAGPAADTWKPRDLVASQSADFAESVGCTAPETMVDCLRELPVEEFTSEAAAGYWSPTLGTPTLPDHPAVAIAGGRTSDVPILIGVNDDEGGYFAGTFFGADPLEQTDLDGLLASAAGPRTPEAIEAYPVEGRTPNRVWGDVISDRGYACPNLTSWRSMADHGTVYVYEFADETAPSWFGEIPSDLAGQGAVHGADIGYLFDLPAAELQLDEKQRALADRLRESWARFATTGDPAHGESDQRSDFDTDGQVMVFTADGPEPVSDTDLAARHHCEIWS